MIKKNKLDNKGYMLIEIILASVIAFGLAYFMFELTLKLKNKNDDLMVETLMSTDNAIISNAIMEYLRENDGVFRCEDNIKIDNDKVYVGPIDDNQKKFIVQINEYASLGSCSSSLNDYNQDGTTYARNNINIPLYITSQNEKHFDIEIYYDVT